MYKPRNIRVIWRTSFRKPTVFIFPFPSDKYSAAPKSNMRSWILLSTRWAITLRAEKQNNHINAFVRSISVFCFGYRWDYSGADDCADQWGMNQPQDWSLKISILSLIFFITLFCFLHSWNIMNQQEISPWRPGKFCFIESLIQNQQHFKDDLLFPCFKIYVRNGRSLNCSILARPLKILKEKSTTVLLLGLMWNIPHIA